MSDPDDAGVERCPVCHHSYVAVAQADRCHTTNTDDIGRVCIDSHTFPIAVYFHMEDADE